MQRNFKTVHSKINEACGSDSNLQTMLERYFIMTPGRCHPFLSSQTEGNIHNAAARSRDLAGTVNARLANNRTALNENSGTTEYTTDKCYWGGDLE